MFSGNGKGGESIYGGYFKGKAWYFVFFCFSSDVKQVWSHTLMRRGLLVVHVLHETNAAWKYFICMSLGINFIVIYNF